MDDNQVWQNVMQEIFSKNLKLCGRPFEAEEMNRQFDGSGPYLTEKIGELAVTTGELEIGDPLCYLNTEYSLVLEKKIPAGIYPVWLSMAAHRVFGLRYLAAKLEVTEKTPVRYEIAMPKGHDISDFNKPGIFAFYGVDTGLACICDRSVSIHYSDFVKKWRKENPDKNLYDDYFEAYFKESAKAYPQYQRPDGDFLDWTLPQRKENIVMVTSGFGDGAYSAYWGYDEAGEICCLILRFIDPQAFDVEMPDLPEEEPVKKKNYFLKEEQIKPLIETDKFALATDRIMVDGCKVGYMERRRPEENYPEDSGWIFFEGTEDQEYLDDTDHMGIYSLNTIANYSPDIIPLLDSEPECGFFRGRDGKFYRDRNYRSAD